MLSQSFVSAALTRLRCTKRRLACQRGESGQAHTHAYLASATFGIGAGGGAGDADKVFAAARFVAVRHKLEIVEPSSGVPKSVEEVVTFCGTIQCEVLSSSVTNETAMSSSSGNIAARVAPQDLNKFLDFVGKQGKIAQHSTESEDKTAAVIDVEARLKNQTEFRDSLRRMLTKPGVSVADLLQIQEKLAEAQAELDSEATQAQDPRQRNRKGLLRSRVPRRAAHG